MKYKLSLRTETTTIVVTVLWWFIGQEISWSHKNCSDLWLVPVVFFCSYCLHTRSKSSLNWAYTHWKHRYASVVISKRIKIWNEKEKLAHELKSVDSCHDLFLLNSRSIHHFRIHNRIKINLLLLFFSLLPKALRMTTSKKIWTLISSIVFKTSIFNWAEWRSVEEEN